jgi:hypothetical protein
MTIFRRHAATIKAATIKAATIKAANGGGQYKKPDLGRETRPELLSLEGRRINSDHYTLDGV